MEHLLDDGETTSCCFAVGSTRRPGTPLQARCAQIGVAVESGVWLRRADDSCVPVEPRGWQHFTDR